MKYNMISGKLIQSLQKGIGILDPLPSMFLDMDMSFTGIFTNIDTYNWKENIQDRLSILGFAAELQEGIIFSCKGCFSKGDK